MNVMASQITGASIVNSAVCSGADQRKHQSSASLAFRICHDAIMIVMAKRNISGIRGGNSNPCLSETHLFIAGLYCCWLLAGRSPLSLIGAHDVWWSYEMAGGRFKKAYKLLNLRALKFSPVNKMHIFQCMDKIFCVEFQREPLKFRTKYRTHALKDTIFIQHWNFKSSWI